MMNISLGRNWKLTLPSKVTYTLEICADEIMTKQIFNAECPRSNFPCTAICFDCPLSSVVSQSSNHDKSSALVVYAGVSSSSSSSDLFRFTPRLASASTSLVVLSTGTWTMNSTVLKYTFQVLPECEVLVFEPQVLVLKYIFQGLALFIFWYSWYFGTCTWRKVKSREVEAVRYVLYRVMYIFFCAVLEIFSQSRLMLTQLQTQSKKNCYQQKRLIIPMALRSPT